MGAVRARSALSVHKKKRVFCFLLACLAIFFFSFLPFLAHWVLQMSQDSSPQEEIKAAIEQWRWSEMQGLELLSASSPTRSALPHPPAAADPDSALESAASARRSVPTKAGEMDAADTAAASAGDGAGDGAGAGAVVSSASSSSSAEHKRDGGGSGVAGGDGEEKPKDVPAVGFGELFRFADGLDYVLMGIGSLGALVHGCSLPLFLRFFADLVNSFGSNANDMDKMMQEVLKVMRPKKK